MARETGSRLRGEVLAGEVIEEAVEIDIVEADPFADAEVRRLPARRLGEEVDAWRGEVRSVAIAAAGGIAVGAAAVTAANAVRRRLAESRKPARRIIKRGKDRHEVLGTRTFLVDVHLLGRQS